MIEMSCRAKAIVTLIVIAPILTEIVSGNTPLHALFHPATSLFLIAAYSLPLLAIRETSIRWRLRPTGVFVLGLAYGILNEGLLAQTLLRRENVPISTFDHYAYAAGINFSWAAVIVPWHALMAVCFPLALLAAWFPACAGARWLNRAAFAIALTILGLGICFVALARQPHVQMRIFLLAIVLLIGAARIFRERRPGDWWRPSRRTAAFVLGFVFYTVFFLGAILLAAVRPPTAIFFIAVAGLLAGFGWLARRNQLDVPPESAHVALGSYLVASLFSIAGGIAHHSIEAIVVGTLLACTFAWLASVPKVFVTM